MPTITLAPNVATRGSTITVFGQGFQKGQRVRLSLDGSGYTQNIYKANAKGEFSVGVQTTSTTALGEHRVDIIPYNAITPILATSTFDLIDVPSSPIMVNATVGNNVVNLTWVAPTSNGGAPISSYKVYRGESVIHTTTLLNFSDTNVTNGNTYSYQISATNIAGEGSKSTSVAAMPIAPITIPSEPQNLTGTVASEQATLSWNPPLNDGGSPILGYNIFRNGIFIGSTDVVLTHTVTGLTNGTTYRFKVSAYNSAGGGVHSPEISLTPAGNSEWELVFSDDFNDRTIARGQFAVGGTDVGYYRILPDGTKQWRNAGVKTADGRYMCMGNLAGSLWADTSRQGYYSDWKTLAVQNGVLDQEFYVDANGKGRTATISPLPLGSTLRGGITGGRVLVRLRADRVVGFKAVPLLWPDDAYDNNMLELGEIDWPEASLDKTPKAYMHYTNASSSSDQAIFTAPAGTTFQEWHDYVIEWKAGVSVEFFIDGQSIGKVTQRIPNTPMHYNLQIETSTDGERPVAGSRGKVLIDKVEVWEQV